MSAPILLALALLAGFALSFGLLVMHTRHQANVQQKVLKGYFLLGLSGLMAKIAQADGSVSVDESDMAIRFFNGMELTQAERAACIGNFISVSRGGESVRDLAKRFLVLATPAASEFLFYLLWKISAVDKVLDPAEDRLLVEIAGYLGVPAVTYERLKAGAVPAFSAATLRASGVPPSLFALA